MVKKLGLWGQYSTHLKKVAQWHIHQDWTETSGAFLRKWPKIRIFTYFGAQSSPEIGPLRPIFSTHLKVLAMSMWSITGVKPVKTFWEIGQIPAFWLTLGPKIAQNLGFQGPYYINPGSQIPQVEARKRCSRDLLTSSGRATALIDCHFWYTFLQ